MCCGKLTVAGYEVSDAEVVDVGVVVYALRPAVAEKKAKKKYTADDFAGIWDDEHFMPAEDINKAIRDARHV